MSDLRGLRPDQVRDLDTLVRRAAERWPDKVAWTFAHTEERLTFADVERRVGRIAAGLRALGVRQGDRVALLLRNVPEFPLGWLGLARLGAVAVPVNVNYRLMDAGHVLEHSGAVVLVTMAEFGALATALCERVPTLEHVVSLDRPIAGGVGLGEADDLEDAFDPPPKVIAERLVNVQYTSGTTGKPKGCMLSHRYWLELALGLVTEFPHLTDDDVLLTAQPFHYVDPQWNVVVSLLAGAELVVLDRFHPTTFWDEVRSRGVTYFYCLGLMPGLLLKMPESPHDRRHRVRAVGCSAIPTGLHARLEERWGAPWHEAFGMTETGSDLQVGEQDHDELIGTGCIGRPRRHREARVVDELDRPVPHGEVGELVLRGTGMMDGYFRDESATASAFRFGWFHTGDLVRMDDQGRVYYVGRKKDMIRRSGENISAAEVEEALQLHPQVSMAAVVAVPDDLRGEEVKAYVVPSGVGAGDAALADRLAAFCAEQLAYFKVPRYWSFLDQLPLTPSERVAKQQLAAGQADPRHEAWDRIDQVWR